MKMTDCTALNIERRETDRAGFVSDSRCCSASVSTAPASVVLDCWLARRKNGDTSCAATNHSTDCFNMLKYAHYKTEPRLLTMLLPGSRAYYCSELNSKTKKVLKNQTWCEHSTEQEQLVQARSNRCASFIYKGQKQAWAHEMFIFRTEKIWNFRTFFRTSESQKNEFFCHFRRI